MVLSLLLSCLVDSDFDTDVIEDSVSLASGASSMSTSESSDSDDSRINNILAESMKWGLETMQGFQGLVGEVEEDSAESGNEEKQRKKKPRKETKQYLQLDNPKHALQVVPTKVRRKLRKYSGDKLKRKLSRYFFKMYMQLSEAAKSRVTATRAEDRPAKLMEEISQQLESSLS